MNHSKIFLFKVQSIFRSLKEYQEFFEGHLLQKISELEIDYKNSLNSDGISINHC